MKNMLSQIIVGVIVTVVGAFVTHALFRGGHFKRANAQHPVTVGDRR